MNKSLLFSAAAVALTLTTACTKNTEDMSQNPFLQEWTLPHGAIPFDQIKVEDYKPAFMAGIEAENQDIDAIINNPEAPTFENTIEALDKAGRLINRVAGVFYNLVECDGTDEMLALSEELQPIMSQHSLDISLNEKLFQRVETVWNQYKDNHESLTTEQWRLLKKTYDGYIRSGATLQGEARNRWREVSAELDSLTLLFSQNVQKATGEWSYQLDSATDLEGLPPFVTEALKENGYKVTLLAPSYRPFMTYSARRDLREMLWRAYNTRCVGGKYDNTEVMRRIALLRQERGKLLGYETFADFKLVPTMAKTPQAVNGLLNQLLEAYRPTAIKDVKEVEDFAHQHGLPAGEKLQSWDFGYYSEQLKTAKYNVNDAMVKPYFPLDKVKEGVFGLATKLYGVTFHKVDVPVYMDEVECFEVIDADSTFLGLLYTDFFPRETKRPGAWMTEFKGQWTENGEDSRPVIQIVMSFSKPIGKPGEEGYTPALLTYDECTTFLHEFGHSLHGLLTKCNYASLSGTNVSRDFVELPSQFNENFMSEKEFLDTFASNYETGEKIPQSLIDRLRDAGNYQAGYLCLRQLSFGMLDMAYHTIGTNDPSAQSVKPQQELLVNTTDAAALPQTLQEFERTAMAPTQVLPTVEGTMMGSSFTHIFSGGYAAGYYGYKWAEVLDADAFAVFQREGLFNAETAGRFRHLLQSGNTEDPSDLYRQFKGADPTIDALMRRDGIKK